MQQIPSSIAAHAYVKDPHDSRRYLARAKRTPHVNIFMGVGPKVGIKRDGVLFEHVCHVLVRILAI